MHNNTPAHMYKDFVASAIVSLSVMPTLKLAYELVEKFNSNLDVCYRLGLTPEECAEDISYEWTNHCRKPVTMGQRISPLKSKACIGVYRI